MWFGLKFQNSKNIKISNDQIKVHELITELNLYIFDHRQL